MAATTRDKTVVETIIQFLKKHTQHHDLKEFSQHGDISIDRISEHQQSFLCSAGSSRIEVKTTMVMELPKLQSEYEGTCFISAILSKHIQKPLIYDDKEDIMVLEALPHDYNSLWSEILNSRVDKVSIQQLAMVLGKLHTSSHAKSNPGEERKRPSGDPSAIDELKSTIFIKPYETGLNEDQSSPSHILLDSNIKAKVQALDQVFCDKKDGFIHGSMNPVNIHSKKGHPIMRNLGLCTVGPFGFDLGTLLASYMSLYHIHMLTTENNDAHRRVAYKMMDACKDTVSTYVEELEKVLEKTEIESVISDAAGFAACELIRRSTPTLLYPGVPLGNDSTKREIMDSGVRLLRQYESIHDAGRLLMIGLMLC